VGWKAGIAERKAMIDPEHDLPIKQQAEVLGISRSTVYYEPRPISAEDLWLMRRIDELHLNYPFAGRRMLRDFLWQQGLVVGRRHIKTLMKRMVIEAIYRKPNTSKPAPGHRIYPYLLRGLAITRPNQVWAMDITYIPMALGFVYLAAVVDWFTRRVISWRLSITMETNFWGGVHQRGLHRAAEETRHQDQHGWPRPLARQRFRRAGVEVDQI
jgi:putative transposase